MSTEDVEEFAPEVDYGEDDVEVAEENINTFDDDEFADLEGDLNDVEANQEKLLDTTKGATKSMEEVQKEKEEAERNRREQDERSVFVSNVDWSVTGTELKDFFAPCGVVVRVTILTDKFQQPKGIAYVEFENKDAVHNALILDGSELKERKLTVTLKRTNVPSYQLRGRGGRGGPVRGGAMRGRGRGAMVMVPAYMVQGRGGFMSVRGRGGSYRGAPRGAPRGRGRGQ